MVPAHSKTRNTHHSPTESSDRPVTRRRASFPAPTRRSARLNPQPKTSLSPGPANGRQKLPTPPPTPSAVWTAPLFQPIKIANVDESWVHRHSIQNYDDTRKLPSPPAERPDEAVPGATSTKEKKKSVHFPPFLEEAAYFLASEPPTAITSPVTSPTDSATLAIFASASSLSTFANFQEQQRQTRRRGMEQTWPRRGSVRTTSSSASSSGEDVWAAFAPALSSTLLGTSAYRSTQYDDDAMDFDGGVKAEDDDEDEVGVYEERWRKRLGC